MFGRVVPALPQITGAGLRDCVVFHCPHLAREDGLSVVQLVESHDAGVEIETRDRKIRVHLGRLLGQFPVARIFIANPRHHLLFPLAVRAVRLVDGLQCRFVFSGVSKIIPRGLALVNHLRDQILIPLLREPIALLVLRVASGATRHVELVFLSSGCFLCLRTA